MAGFRTFATGEVLTAANVNDFLMGQSVMRFADADARTAALGTDVVEGMLTYNLDTDQLEVFDGTNFVVAAPAPPAGIGSNVVSTTKTNQFSSSSASFVPVTGLDVTITPTSDTAKILVIMYSVISNTSAFSGAAIQLVRGGTAILRGDSSGNKVRATYGHFFSGTNDAFAVTAVFLDSPNTTGATTYGAQVRRGTGGTVVVNRTGDATNDARNAVSASTITAIEVAA